MSRPGGRPGPWPSQTQSQSQSQSQQQQPQPLSWAKRTAFKNAPIPNSGQFTFPTPNATPPAAPDLESGPTATTPPATATASAALPLPPATAPPASATGGQNRSGSRVNGGVNGGSKEKTPPPSSRQREREVPAPRPREREVVVEEDPDDDFPQRQPHVVKYQLRDTPGLLPIVYYGLQHYLSILGSLILIPLVIVPAMGGSYEDRAAVVSTVLLVSGISTLLHTSLGTRLPLIQGPSFVYLAPALALINSSEFQALNQNNFKHIMKELQGALIISAAFQAFIGYTGLMTLFLRLINPIVVSSTIAAVGLSFFSYGFTQVGACLEIGILQLLLVFIFSLYLRKIKILGYRAFLIYTVPLGLGITWAIAFILTETGVYSYKGCDANIPASNNVSEYCRKHVTRMKSCRANTSHALRDAPWFRFPYPLQWGTPVFNWKMALVMCVVSLIASVDSVGSYHASSLLVAEKPPTAGVVSRGIGMEGITGLLAGIWGTGFGSSTLTENVHTIAVTKMGSRRAVEFGAILLILISLIGKVGGFIASIPDVMVGALLCFMWAMLAALGFSNLRYSANGSSRNSIVVGLALFFSLSVPAYFQQYGMHPNSNVSVPSYFQPYIVASHGPFHTPYAGVNYVLNTLLSFNMVIAFIIALVLDNTVPGSRQERGVYVWSKSEAARREPAVVKDYQLPFNMSRLFGWVKWVGL